MRRATRHLRWLPVAACLVGLANGATAQSLEPPLPDLTGIVKDADWAKILGKALFWDQQAGSDGMACASCHFSAGADSRITNQLSPGLLQHPVADLTFGPTEGAGTPTGSNYTVKPEDFPFHKLTDITDRNSDIIQTTNDRMSSSGAFDAPFVGVDRRDGESCGDAVADTFHAGGYAARTVEPRNTPTVVNAAFNFRNFWDGRANNIFNGKDVFGRRDYADPAKRIIVKAGRDLKLEFLELENASLASQAVGPPLSALEMSCGGRTFADVGRKLLSPAQRPLQLQKVDAYDSLLGQPGPKGDLRSLTGYGLHGSHGYADMIKRAFHEKYWDALGKYTITPDGKLIRDRYGYTQMEHNFSMFWGISIMLYEATLISDQSKFDDAAAALPCLNNPFAPVCDPVTPGLLTELEHDGLRLFNGGFIPGTPGGFCFGCHGAPLFTSAGNLAGADPLLIARIGFGPEPDLEDFGFFNLGTRPVNEDLGLGGTDPYGNPLSFTRQFKASRQFNDPSRLVDGIGFTCDDFPPPLNAPFPTCPGGLPTGPGVEEEHITVDGAMKAPALRNVALTPPYFHYGGYATLEQVIEFYARGGSRRDKSLLDASFTGDDSGSGEFGDGPVPTPGPHFGRNAHPLINPLNLALDPGAGKDQAYGIKALVAFLKTLTDQRVQCDKAPFDHPSLTVFHGHEEYDLNGDGKAEDIVAKVPAVGKHGYAPHSGLCVPNAGDLFAPGMQARLLP